MALSGEKKRQANARAYARRKVLLARANPAKAIARYAQRVLRVPPGHKRAGQPMTLPKYGRAFLDDALKPSTREALLAVSRKNAKSACVAAVLTAYLDVNGPFRVEGFRAGVLSVSRSKAYELIAQIEAISVASGIDHHRTLRPNGLRFYRTPAPGRVVSPAGTVEIESADRGAGSQ